MTDNNDFPSLKPRMGRVDAQKPTTEMPAPTSADELLSEEDLLAPVAKTDLLSQIKSGQPEPDAEDEKKKKKRKKINWQLAMGRALHTTAEEYLHLRREMRRFARFRKYFYAVWGVFLSFLYLTCITFFTAAVLIKIYFYYLLGVVLEREGLGDFSFKVLSHSLNSMELRSIHDKFNRVEIQKMVVRYRLDHLLKGKVDQVEVDGLSIHLRDSEAGFDLEELLSTIMRVTSLEEKLSMNVQIFQIKNATLFVGNKERPLPIDFSGLGDFKSKREIDLPLSLNSSLLKADATLTASFEGKTTKWSMVVEKGRLSIPNQPSKDVRIKLTFVTKSGKLDGLNIDLTTLDGDMSTFAVNVLPAGKDKLNIDFSFTTPLKDEPLKRYSLNVSLKNVDIPNNLTKLETDRPISVNMTNISNQVFKAASLRAVLMGRLICERDNCKYRLTSPSEVLIFDLEKEVGNYFIDAPYPIKLSLSPEGEKDMFVFNKEGVAYFSQVLSPSLVFRRRLAENQPQSVSVDAKTLSLNGNYSLKKGVQSSVVVESDGLTYLDNDLSMRRATFKAVLSMAGGAFRLTSPITKMLSSSLIKKEFFIDLSMTSDEYFETEIKTLDNFVSFVANGYYSPISGEILAAVKTTKPIEFKKTQELTKLSSIFPEDLKDVSGKLQIKGQVHYKNARSISGPISALIENMDFSYNNVQVDDLNGLLDITSIVPFGTKLVNQDLFAKRIDAVLPLTDVHASFTCDLSRRQLYVSSLDGKVASIPVSVASNWYNYGQDAYDFIFSSKKFEADELLKNIRLPNFDVNATAQMDYILSFENEQALLKSFSIVADNGGSIVYTGKKTLSKDYEIFNNASFKRLSVMLTSVSKDLTNATLVMEQRDGMRIKRQNVRLNIRRPLLDFIISRGNYTVPALFKAQKESF